MIIDSDSREMERYTADNVLQFSHCFGTAHSFHYRHSELNAIENPLGDVIFLLSHGLSWITSHHLRPLNNADKHLLKKILLTTKKKQKEKETHALSENQHPFRSSPSLKIQPCSIVSCRLFAAAAQDTQYFVIYFVAIIFSFRV